MSATWGEIVDFVQTSIEAAHLKTANHNLKVCQVNRHQYPVNNSPLHFLS